MASTILIPAYGRDYTSAKAVRADWDAGKDFTVSDHFNAYDGKPANKDSFKNGDRVQIRFKRMTQICVIEVK